MKKVLLHTALALLSQIGYTQVNGIFPLPLLRYQDNNSFENPASSVTLKSTELKLLHAAYTGIAGSVGLNYLNGTIRKASKKTNGVHAPGIMIHSEYDTDILKRTRVYLKYSWSTSLSYTTRISAGIQIGFFNYSVKSSNSSAGISVFVPDANIGIWLHHKKLNLGFSLPQMVSSEIKPINRIYSLNRYGTANFDFNLFSSTSNVLTIGIKAFHNGKDYKGLSTSLQFLFAKNLSTEINYSINKGMAFSIGVVDFSMIQLMGSLYFTYFHSSLNASLLNTDRLEIGLGFKLKPKEFPLPSN